MTNVLNVTGGTTGCKWRVVCVLELPVAKKHWGRQFVSTIWHQAGARQHYGDVARQAMETLRTTELENYRHFRDDPVTESVHYALQVEEDGDWCTTSIMTLRFERLLKEQASAAAVTALA
jgi:hypothetical protein